jgi:ribosomal protein L7Ae-like RNA K-turn-binding protein
MCEDAGIAYAFVSSKHLLGAACGTKRPTSVVLLQPGDGVKFAKKYKDTVEQVKDIAPRML